MSGYYNTILQQYYQTIPPYSEIVEKLSNGGNNPVSVNDIYSAMVEGYNYLDECNLITQISKENRDAAFTNEFYALGTLRKVIQAGKNIPSNQETFVVDGITYSRQIKVDPQTFYSLEKKLRRHLQIDQLHSRSHN